MKMIKLRPSESCGRPGCLALHRKYPCEGCGRIHGQYPTNDEMNESFEIVEKNLFVLEESIRGLNIGWMQKYTLLKPIFDIRTAQQKARERNESRNKALSIITGESK